MKKGRALAALAMLLAAVMLLAGAGSLSVSAATRISPEPDFVPGEATLTQMRAFFQNGAYWNHVSGTEDTPYSVTDTPCSPYTASDGLHKDEGVVCNYFEIPGKVWGGWQCCGFTRLMTYLYFGTSCENWETSTSLSGMKAGDVLYLTSGGPHYIWILSLADNGDGTKKITYTDCNGAGRRFHCQIQWDARCTVNMKTQELELAAIGTWDVLKRYVSPGGARTVLPESFAGAVTTGYAVTYADGQGQTAATVATGDVTLAACGFRRAGYTFAGWTVQRDPDGAWLSENKWKSVAAASDATVYDAGQKLSSSLFTVGVSYTVVATWTENRMTVRYAPNGGQCTSGTYSVDANGTVVRGKKPVENEWSYSSLTGAEILPRAEDWGIVRSGYTFVGWAFAPGNSITATAENLAARLASRGGEETWYAVWVPNMAAVWYRADDGTLTSDDYQLLSNGRIVCREDAAWAPTRLFYNGTATLLTAEDLGLERDGYRFVGWTADGKTLVNETAIKRMMNDRFRVQVELTAVWEKNEGPTGPPSTKERTTS